MTTNDIQNAISTWTSWATANSNSRFDIALLKIWIQFEKFTAELFVNYATGIPSEEGYSPTLNLQFSSAEQLNVFLREGTKKYVDYPRQIEKFSKHIFTNDPFSVIFQDTDNKSAYDQIVAIRNYIAHESAEAKIKMTKLCFSGNESKFKEPNEYLKSIPQGQNQSYFTYYTQKIHDITTLLVNPPQ